jgi:hypothetical protein
METEAEVEVVAAVMMGMVETETAVTEVAEMT